MRHYVFLPITNEKVMTYASRPEKYARNLLWRNIKGAFTFDDNYWEAPGLHFTATAIVVLAPITVAVAALKTLYDLATRHFVGKDRIDKFTTKLDNANAEEVEAIREHIRRMPFSSASSNKLRSELDSTSEEGWFQTSILLKTKIEEYQKEQINLALQQLPPNHNLRISCNQPDKTKLQEIKETVKGEITAIEFQNLQAQKQLIKDYVQAPHNNGKKMQHVFFKAFEKEQSTPETKAQSLSTTF